MGCCQSKTNNGAFRRNIQDKDLVDDLLPKLPNDAKVFVVRLLSLSEIPIGNTYKGWSDAFVELKLLPGDKNAGDQKQISSTKPSTLNPKWEPPERFQFIVSKFDSKILLSVYHFVLSDPKASIALGDGVLKLKDLPHTSAIEEKTVKLTSPTDGKPAGEVTVSIQVLSLAEASSVQEHVVYEYQRWQPGYNWGAAEDPSKHLLPTDPGRWCTEDGKRFGKTLDSVAPPIPGDWEESVGWHTVSSDHDPEGWQYAVSFESPYWHAENNSSTYVVRRRSWHREVKKIAADKRSSSTASASSQDKPGRRQRLTAGKNLRNSSTSK